MARQIKIKEIAKLAGVSAGTVDRVLHNRGKVSAKAQASVEKVLSEVNYKLDIHTSAISFRKEFHILVILPKATCGGYWKMQRRGISDALEEYSDINTSCIWMEYDQFDLKDCHRVYTEALEVKGIDAFIIGPTFIQETRLLCSALEKRGTPYFFVDAVPSETNPWASFSSDQMAAGMVMAKMICRMFRSDNDEIAVLDAHREGVEVPLNPALRFIGFRSVLEERGILLRLRSDTISPNDMKKTEERVASMLKRFPSVRIIAVLNSMGYLVADAVKKAGENVPVVCFDVTEENATRLEDGSIAALLGQRPHRQGFEALKAAINCLLYRQKEANPQHIMPIDIIVKDNLPYYQE